LGERESFGIVWVSGFGLSVLITGLYIEDLGIGVSGLDFGILGFGIWVYRLVVAMQI
jgi:hypothetical protein